MSLRTARKSLEFLLVIIVSVAATAIFLDRRSQKSSRKTADEVILFCELPELPAEVIIRNAAILPSQTEGYIDVSLQLEAETDLLGSWLDKVDDWKKNRPGKVYNFRLRESEYSSRVDFSAEVFTE